MTLGVSALLGAGCIFSPKKAPPGVIVPPPPPVYPQLSYPDRVLDALQIAYSHKDTTFTKTIYDSTYIGFSEDLSDPKAPPPISTTYDSEIAHVAALARAPTISDVSMNLGPSTTWTRLTSDDISHPEWAVIQITSTFVRISVTDGPDTYLVTGDAEFLEFKFVPTLDSTSQSDTLWKIIRWKETKSP